jgi:glycosyltransferase involved in cell wall biosynthesis
VATIGRSGGAPATILHVITSLGVGGAEQQLVNLVRGGRGTSLRQVVCQLGPPDDLAETLRDSGCEVIRLNDRRKRRYVWAYRGLAEAIARVKPDVVHAWLFHARFAAFAAGWRTSTARVSSLQGTDYEPASIDQTGLSPTRMSAQLRLERAMVARGGVYVAASQAVRDSYVRRVGIAPEQIRVIPNSVDPARVAAGRGDRRSVRQRLGVPDTGFLFLNISRLVAGKGQTELLAAFDRLAGEDPEVWLALAGEGPLESRLSAAATGAASAERIQTLGTVSGVGELLAAADAFVFPSYSEGFPVALVEAMLVGLPILASDIPAVREMAGQPPTMLLTPPGDLPALTESLRRLRRESEGLRSRGTRASARARDLYVSGQTFPLWLAAWGAAVDRASRATA